VKSVYHFQILEISRRSHPGIQKFILLNQVRQEDQVGGIDIEFVLREVAVSERLLHQFAANNMEHFWHKVLELFRREVNFKNFENGVHEVFLADYDELI